ncbi:hypothetical protein OG909_17040 [Streptomyces sp. NBC_01754]|uniref:hypothetical protein n=1 Tax=Streptomyces sp. NBC_01754 TaxID=2975930 RepID=UPI002DD8BCE8|nr:hypothetical protein [Streptomyces sp. NBC_01754]WSC93840.1 hypothetical protein OG909_17040 [Streptomyces sp. NBC_01754]
MSRTQWCCLAAVLAVVLGLFGTSAVGDPSPAVAADAVPVPVAAPAPVPVPVPLAVSVPGGGDTAPAVPGCDRDRGDQGADPALPARNRVSHDQVPGCAVPAPVAAVGRGLLPAAARIAVRGSRSAGPTPVGLSVLRV